MMHALHGLVPFFCKRKTKHIQKTESPKISKCTKPFIGADFYGRFRFVIIYVHFYNILWEKSMIYSIKLNNKMNESKKRKN